MFKRTISEIKEEIAFLDMEANRSGRPDEYYERLARRKAALKKIANDLQDYDDGNIQQIIHK